MFQSPLSTCVTHVIRFILQFVLIAPIPKPCIVCVSGARTWGLLCEDHLAKLVVEGDVPVGTYGIKGRADNARLTEVTELRAHRPWDRHKVWEGTVWDTGTYRHRLYIRMDLDSRKWNQCRRNLDSLERPVEGDTSGCKKKSMRKMTRLLTWFRVLLNFFNTAGYSFWEIIVPFRVK